MLSCLCTGNPISKRWSLCHTRVKPAENRSFESFSLWAFLSAPAVGTYSDISIFKERGPWSLSFFPCLKINNLYFLKFACLQWDPQYFNVFWGLLHPWPNAHVSCSTCPCFALVWSGAESLLRSEFCPLTSLQDPRKVFCSARSSFLPWDW